MSNKEDDLLTG